MQVQDWVQTWVGAQSSADAAPDGSGETRAAVDPAAEAEVHAARSRLEEAVGELGDRLVATGCPLPLRLSNSTITNVDRCDGLAVARAGGSGVDPNWPMLRGRALDSYVQHVLIAGRVGDPVEDLRSMWMADELDETLAALDDHLTSDAREDLESDLSLLAAEAATLAPLAQLMPRLEQRLEVTIGGVLALPGRVDVLLGGAGTGAPSVLLEVKSSALRSEHMTQVRHYGLLQALREGRPPLAAGVWSPGVGVTDVPLTNTFGSSAERVVGSLVRTSALWEGAPVGLNPGSHCRFCPEVDRCPEGMTVASGSGDADHDDGSDW